MKRLHRRVFGNPTLGAQPSASGDNAIASDREDAWNQQAAASYAASRPPNRADYEAELMSGENSDPDISNGRVDATNQARAALAKVLGYTDVRTAPPLQQMMSRFYSLPSNVQAGIYKQGGAQFINPQSGMKMLQTAADDKEKMLDAHTNQIGENLATGKINYDVGSDGKPQFYALQDDETDPLGQKKKKVPLNTIQLALLDRGFKKGIIPNPFNPETAPDAVDKTPKTTDDMIGVLNARQKAPISTSDWNNLSPEGKATFAQYNPGTDMNLEGYKLPPQDIPLPTTGPVARSNMSLSPYNYGSPMQFKSPVGEQYGPAIPDDFTNDSAVKAHRAIASALSGVANSSVPNDALDAIGQTYFKDLPNAVGRGADWLGSLFTGDSSTPPPDSFQTTVVPSRLSAVDAAMIAAQQRQRQQQEQAPPPPPLELMDYAQPMTTPY